MSTENLESVAALVFAESRPHDDSSSETASVASSSCIHERFVDDDEDLLSTQSHSLASTAQTNASADVVYSRALMNAMRSNFNGLGLPSFSVLSLRTELELPPPSPREPGRMCLLSAGVIDRSAEVWHDIATGFSVMPQVEAEFPEPTQCNFCADVALVGPPVIILRHVTTFQGDQQRVRLQVGRICRCCVRARNIEIPPAPRRYGSITIEEKLTLRLTYVVMGMRDMLQNFRIQAQEETPLCDQCFRQLSETADYKTLVVQRVDKTEIAVLLACSEHCRAQLADIVIKLTTEVPRLTPAPAKRRFSRKQAPPPPEERLSDQMELQIAQWQVLRPEELTSVVSTDNSALLRNALIHKCSSTSCFCRTTHRGPFSPNRTRLGIGAPKTRVEIDYILHRVFEELTRVSLYIDILGCDAEARCIVCRKPTRRGCTVCYAVRICSPECGAGYEKEHKKSCYPHAKAWTPFKTL